jgi:hypothetical protein
MRALSICLLLIVDFGVLARRRLAVIASKTYSKSGSLCGSKGRRKGLHPCSLFDETDDDCKYYKLAS